MPAYSGKARTVQGVEQANREINSNIDEIDKINTALKSNTTIHIKEFDIVVAVEAIETQLKVRKNQLLQRNKQLQDVLNEVGKLLLSIDCY